MLNEDSLNEFTTAVECRPEISWQHAALGGRHMMTASLESLLPEFEHALEAMDRMAARKVLRSALAFQSPFQIVEGLVGPALENMGAKWELGELALSQIYMGGRICEEVVDSILPRAATSEASQPSLAIAVLEDHHMLGKRIVYSQLRASGFALLDYGRVEVNTLIGQVQKDHVSILLISTLMLPSALRVRDVRDGLRAAGWEGKIVVGGAPFRLDPELWREVGADATSSSASGAVALIKQLGGQAS
jgi:methanogenic corrinoid protein MtbC1